MIFRPLLLDEDNIDIPSNILIEANDETEAFGIGHRYYTKCPDLHFIGVETLIFVEGIYERAVDRIETTVVEEEGSGRFSSRSCPLEVASSE